MDEMKKKDIIFGILMIIALFSAGFMLGSFYPINVDGDKEQKNCYFLEYNYTVPYEFPDNKTDAAEKNDYNYTIFGYDVHNQTELLDRLNSLSRRNLTPEFIELRNADCSLRNKGLSEILEVK